MAVPPFATLQDLYDAYPRTEIDRLLDKNNTGNPDDGTLAMAQQYADTKINSIIGNRVQALLAEPEKLTMVKFPAVALMRWFLYGTRVTDEVQRRADDAIATLKDIRAGLADIGQAGGAAATAETSSTIEMRSPPGRWGGGAF
jgi:phage gp36-like protein